MKQFAVVLLLFCASLVSAQAPAPIRGFRDSAAEAEVEKRFLDVPDPKRAEEHLRFLTAQPHIAGSTEDRKTAEYIAQKYREAGLDTHIVEYKVWLNYPEEISVDVTAPAGVKMHGPSRERVVGDSFQDDPRIVTAFNGYSPSADVEAEVVYANYGRPEDIQKLKQMGIDLRGKILVVRYGQNFRGVKTLVAQEAGAAGVIIYSDPMDDGWFKGDKYPQGPWRPATGVQRGSIGYMFEFAGDPTTPGVASVASLPDAKRISPQQSAEMPKIPTTPLSYADAQPILQNLSGPDSPRDWQGALPFTYHVGPGPVRVKMHLRQNYAFRTIWNVVGIVRGTEAPNQWVIAGNHHDAWAFGAVDPGSGTVAQLEAVHGIGELLKSGWKPKRTLVFASWDAEEYGLIGSTEWAEEHENELRNAVAYLNTDVGVAGPNFVAASVPSLKQFLRDVAKSVPSPKGASVYDAWLDTQRKSGAAHSVIPQLVGGNAQERLWDDDKAHVGDLGSGSDYTAFLQHLGVPSTDIGSNGSYGVYHSAFDNLDWFRKFADPAFVYEQQMARIYGLECIRLAAADVLPYDYEEYGREIVSYLEASRKQAEDRFGDKAPSYVPALDAARRLQRVGHDLNALPMLSAQDAARLNTILIGAERGFLTDGLPKRPWYKHAIYAPGEYTGYAAVVLPGPTEEIPRGDLSALRSQLEAVADAINRVANILETYH